MNKTNLSAYMAMTVSQLKEEQRMGTAHVYQSTLNRIKDFMEQDSISFEEVTPVWLKAFQEYLLERQLHWNTISTYMRMLRATYCRRRWAGSLSAQAVQGSIYGNKGNCETCCG